MSSDKHQSAPADGMMRPRKKNRDCVKTGKTGNSNPRLFVSPQEEEMLFKLDIYCKLQRALNSMFDAGHCVAPQPSPYLSLTYAGRIYFVCLQLLFYAGSHYCSLSRSGLIVPHLTISQLCTKLAACCCRVGEEH